MKHAATSVSTMEMSIAWRALYAVIMVGWLFQRIAQPSFLAIQKHRVKSMKGRPLAMILNVEAEENVRSVRTQNVEKSVMKKNVKPILLLACVLRNVHQKN